MSRAMPPEEIRKNENDLIEIHFPWGASVHPLKETLETPENRREYVLKWLGEEVVQCQTWATALLARLRVVLDEMEAQLPMEEKGRFFNRVDASHIVKSPESILEKMARRWERLGKDGENQPQYSFGNLHEMQDLCRFRVIVNFLSDARMVAEKITGICSPDPVIETEAEKALSHEFRLQGNKFEDFIDRLPDLRTSGERCYKGIFCPVSDPDVHVEVQITTILQEAWDKKDHYLIYERRRVGKMPKLEHRIRMFSMSELLFIADDTFDRLKMEIESKDQ